MVRRFGPIIMKMGLSALALMTSCKMPTESFGLLPGIRVCFGTMEFVLRRSMRLAILARGEDLSYPTIEGISGSAPCIEVCSATTAPQRLTTLLRMVWPAVESWLFLRTAMVMCGWRPQRVGSAAMMVPASPHTMSMMGWVVIRSGPSPRIEKDGCCSAPGVAV